MKFWNWNRLDFFLLKRETSSFNHPFAKEITMEKAGFYFRPFTLSHNISGRQQHVRRSQKNVDILSANLESLLLKPTVFRVILILVYI